MAYVPSSFTCPDLKLEEVMESTHRKLRASPRPKTKPLGTSLPIQVKAHGAQGTEIMYASNV